MRSKRKFNKTREWVIEEYVNKNRSRKEVAEECGLTIGGFKSYLLEQKIVKDKNEIKKECLEEEINKNKTVSEIAKHFNCSKSKINKYCKKYNLKIKAHEVYEQYDDTNDAIIIDMYNKGCSSTEIGEYLGITHRTVLNHLNKCNIKRRTLSESQWNYNGKTIHPDLLNYDILYDLYINQRMSKKDLGLKYECSPRVIDNFLKKYNIPIRGDSEAKIGLMSGNKHPNWQGGICELDLRLRTYTKVNLNKKVLKRDYYKCQLCGSKKILHIHHIKPFNEVVSEICNEHKNLDVVKDINKLYDIIINDGRFTDLNNLITYCKNCHFYKIHMYEKNDK